MVNRAEFIHIVPFAVPSGFLFSGSYISHISLHQRLIDSIFFPSTISPCEQQSPYKFLIYLLSGMLVLAPIASIAHELKGHQEEHGRMNASRATSQQPTTAQSLRACPNTTLVHPSPLCTTVRRPLPYLRFKQKRKSPSRHTLETAVTFLSLEDFPFVRNARSLTRAAIYFARNHTPSGTGQRFTVKVTKMEFNRKRGVLIPILSLSLWMGTTTGALAGESSDIDEIVVQASLAHGTTDEGMTTLHLVNKDQIKSMPVLSLGSSLEGLLGVNVSDYGSGVGQPVIRGMSGSRVRVLENGSIVRDVSG